MFSDSGHRRAIQITLLLILLGAAGAAWIAPIVKRNRSYPPDTECVQQVASEEADARNDKSKRETHLAMSLHALLKRHGNLADALVAKGLEPQLDAQGEVTAITDAMMRGNLTDREFELLAQLKNLRRLILRDTRLTDKGLSALAKMAQLEGLLLENDESHRLSDASLENLRYLPRLKEFSLDSSKASGTGLKHILNPELLENLSFDRTPISHEGIKAISRFFQLAISRALEKRGYY